MSADRTLGVTIIAFLGSVFSPFYFRARRETQMADPLDHAALNVCLYAPGRQVWALTEFPRSQVERGRGFLRLGKSRMGWEGDTLTVEIDERETLFRGAAGAPVRGTIRLRPQARWPRTPLALDAGGRHRWWALAPRAGLEVSFPEPSIAFTGSGYHDANAGNEPIERGFRFWTWSRADLPRSTAVLYELDRRQGGLWTWGSLYGADGSVTPLAPQARHRLPRTRWLMPRATLADPGPRPRVLATLTDAPFYARSLLRTHLGGDESVAMHESLSLDRFGSRMVQWMLPYKTRRILQEG